MNTVDAAKNVEATGGDGLWIAAAVVIVLTVIGVFWVFRRDDSDESDKRYQDTEYDPVVAAKTARRRAQVNDEITTQASDADADGLRGALLEPGQPKPGRNLPES